MATAEVGALRVRLGMDAGEFTRGTNQVGGSMDKLAAKAQRLGAAIGAALATEAIVNFAQLSLRAFTEQEDAIAAVEAAVKSTGGTAGFTTKELVKMAEGLQKVSNFADEDILKNATANLLTFTNIVAENFPLAQQAVLDLSARLGQDLQSSAIQVGKALNDPIKGITALRRVGVAFSASQREMIRSLVESGEIMKAQKLILAELGKEFGGQAQALTQTVAGQMTQAAHAFGEAMETIGGAFAPVFLAAATAVKVVSDAFQSLSPEMQRFIVYAVGSSTVITAMAVAGGVLVGVLGTMLSPLLAVAAGIGLLSGAVAAFWPNLARVAELAGNAFSSVYNSAKTWLLDNLGPVFDSVISKIQAVGGALVWLGQQVGVLAMEGLEDNLASKGLGPLVEGVKTGLAAVQEAWVGGAAEAEKQAPAIAKGLAAAQVQAASLAEASALKQKDAAKLALSEQQKLIEEGVKLAEKVRTPFEVMADKVTALDAAMAAGKITAEQYGQAMTTSGYIAQNAYASMASNIAGSLQTVFANSKAVAIAAALINTYEGVTKALAAYPPPWNYVAAAATLAAGLAQVANIRKTTKGGGGGGGGGGGVGAAAAAAPQGGVQQSLLVKGISPGQMFSGDAVRGLAAQLIEFQKNGGKVVLQ